MSGNLKRNLLLALAGAVAIGAQVANWKRVHGQAPPALRVTQSQGQLAPGVDPLVQGRGQGEIVLLNLGRTWVVMDVTDGNGAEVGYGALEGTGWDGGVATDQDGQLAFGTAPGTYTVVLASASHGGAVVVVPVTVVAGGWVELDAVAD